jgi:hypothetical protein
MFLKFNMPMFLLKKATLVKISKKPGAGFNDPVLCLIILPVFLHRQFFKG